MGISKFYAWIESLCERTKKKIKLDTLKNKVIAIDTSILLYRFKKQSHLIPKMFLFCTLLRRYNICPIFVFDGIPNKNKYNTIQNRMNKKKQYYEKYLELKHLVDTKTDVDKHTLHEELRYYYNQSICIEKHEIQEVQTLLELYGMNYIVAENEADFCCSDLIKNGTAYGVLSDDSDMFALGCKRVFRFLDVLNHTVIMYDANVLYDEIGMDEKSFQWLCMISRNDYRCEKTDDTIDELYNQLLLLPKEWRDTSTSTYEGEYLCCYNPDDNNHTSIYSNKQYDKRKLMKYLEPYGFIHDN